MAGVALNPGRQMIEDRNNNSMMRGLWWKIPLVLLLIGMGPLYYFGVRGGAVTGVVNYPTVAEVPLGDGGCLEFYQVDLGRNLTIQRKVSRWASAFGASSSRGYGAGSFMIDLSKANGRLEEATLETEVPQLLLLVRRFDVAGIPVSTDVFGSGESNSPSYRVERDVNGCFESLESFTKGVPVPLPSYRIEVEDGAGGWLPAMGPLIPHAGDGRGFVIAPVFPRRAPILRFRIQLDSGEAGEFELPNPGYVKSLPAWTADTIPWRTALADGAVFVKEIGEMKRPGRGPIPKVTFGFEPDGDQLPGAFQVRALEVADVTGNRGSLRDFDILPGTRLLRYHGTVQRSRQYAWRRAEVTVIATGVREKGKTTITMTPVGEATNYGLSVLSLEEKTMGKPKAGVLPKWTVLVQGKGKESVVPPALFRGETLMIFLDDADRSAGSVSGMSGSRGSSGGIVDYKFRTEWTGDIPVGQKIEFAFVSPPSPSSFFFTLSLEDAEKESAEKDAE